jgi:3-isopropylmalate/(R)-2-methylmalate dehydratase large subunit
MEVRVRATLGAGVTPKDVVLHIIGVIGTAGGTGHVIEYRGSVFEDLSIEGRLTVCNMSIEGGARAGLIAPDEKTFAYLKGRPMAPKGSGLGHAAVAYWKSLATDPGALSTARWCIDAADIAPTVTWGTSPEDVVPITGNVPARKLRRPRRSSAAAEKALDYMGLTAGSDDRRRIENVFIGSCTNSRIEDLRAAAAVAKGRKGAPVKWAMVVPGSGLVKDAGRGRGAGRIFIEAGL